MAKRKRPTEADKAQARARARLEVCKTLDVAVTNARRSVYHLKIIRAEKRHIRAAERAEKILRDLLRNCV